MTPTATKYGADFVKFIKEYDGRRDKNFGETFVEFAHLLEDWNE